MNTNNKSDSQTGEYRTETIQTVEFVKFSADSQKDKSFIAPIIGAIIFILPIVIAFRLCDWRVVLSFLVSIIAVPAIFLGLIIYIGNHSFKLSEFGVLLSILALFGIPIYLVLVLPLYYLLLGLSFPIWISFPMINTLVVSGVFFLLATKPPKLIDVAFLIGCCLLHALVIVLGVVLLKKWFP